jgi:hypothetical protein
VSIKYRWANFCSGNNLNIGDTYFFNMIHEATYSNDEDEKREEEEEGDEAKLKVEVHKTNNGWRW